MVLQQDKKNIDPNAKPVQLNCTTSLASYISYRSDYHSNQLNVLHTAAKYNSVKSLKILLDFIVTEKVLIYYLLLPTLTQLESPYRCFSVSYSLFSLFSYFLRLNK